MTFISRRSPWLVPRPAGPDEAAVPHEPLLRLLLAAAWRPRALAVSLAGALGRVPGGAPQAALHARIGALLAASEAFADLSRERGLEDAERQVQARLAGEPLPAAASWAESALADETYGRALDLAWLDLADSADEGVAETARSAPTAPSVSTEALAAFAEDEKNRDCLQILIDRWLPPAVRVFGLPGGQVEPALLERRIKPRDSEAACAAFLADVERRLGGLSLTLPDAARMGVTAPAGWRPRRAPD